MKLTLINGLALAATLSLIAGACSSPSSPASDTAGSTPSATAAATSSPTEAATSLPTRAPRPTPIPTLPSTSEDATAAPSGAISIQMTFVDGPRFVPDQVTASAGTVAFFIQNIRPPSFQPVDHNMAIGPEIHMVLARSSFVRVDKSTVFTVEGLAPGTYTFWCEVNVHADEGMVGTLTITP